MARIRLAALNRRPPLPARLLLARGGLHPAEVGAVLLLNAASYCSRWVLLSQAPAADVAGTLRPRPP